MKKLFSFFLSLAVIMSISTVSADAQSAALNRALKKEFKAKLKDLNKKGWELFASSRSLEVTLLQHYEKLNQEGVFEITGTANAKTKNVLHQFAINNACNNYARQASSYVRGRIASDMATDAADVSAEFDRFYAAYETLVEKEIKGELRESFALIREVEKGVLEMEVYFIVDENAAHQARIRAFENAAKESAVAQKYAEQISDFINEGFDARSK